MTFRIGRRAFITLLGGTAAWPLAAHAQQPAKLPTIGYLGSGTPSTHGQLIAGFVQRLRELGWIEGRTIAIEYRWADGRFERFAEIAAEFVRLKVDVILAGGTEAAIAAKQATSIIPIVFPTAGDPVGSRLVASLARPGGNVTGLSNLGTGLAAKRLELLREVFPGLRRLAVMINSDYSGGVTERGEIDEAARTLGVEIVPLPIRRVEDRVGLRGAQGPRRGVLHYRRFPREHAPPPHQHLCARRAPADDVPATGVRRSGRSDVLWRELPGPEPARRRFRR
jgi:putative ABC transport system substrate-binding protein